MAGQSTISLGEARLLRRLRVGEVAAFQELWGQFRNAVWSVCVPMAGDQDAAVQLLQRVYSGLPREVRGWLSDHPLCCQVGAHVYRTIAAELELDSLAGIHVDIPGATAAPQPGQVTALIAQMEPHVRLVYLCDLLFGCPAGATALLVGESEQSIRDARSAAAWRLVAVGGAR